VRHSLPALVSILVVSSGCLFDAPVPADARIKCDTTEDCPDGFRCQTEVHRCVSPDRTDQVAPAILGEAQLTPAVARALSVVTLSFEVSEAVASTPVVTLGGSGGATFDHDVEASDEAEQRWVFTYVTRGSEPQGEDVIVAVTLRDEWDNTAGGVTAGTVRFDFEDPELIDAELSPTALATGSTATLRLRYDEPLSAPPEVRLVDAPADAPTFTLTSSTDDEEFIFELTADDTAPSGSWTVDAAAIDLAGNRSAESVDTLSLDAEMPAVTSSAVTPRIARSGTIISVDAVLSERVPTPPRVVASDDSGEAFTFTFEQDVGLSYSWFYVVPENVFPPGDYTLSLDGLVDAAGNAAAAVDLGALELDFDAPEATVTSATGTDIKLALGDDVQVELSFDEPLGVPPRAYLGVNEMTLDSAFVAGETLTAQFSLALVDGVTLPSDVPVPFAVDIVDLAGNRFIGDLEEKVTVDAQPPALVDVTFSPAAAGLGTNALLTVTVSEALGAAPVLQWDDALGDPGFTYRDSSGLNYVYELTVDGNVPSGSYSVLGASFADLVGNATSATLATPETFSVDSEAPTIGVLSMTPVGRPVGLGDFLVVELEVADPTATVVASLPTGPLTEITPTLPGATHAFQVDAGDPGQISLEGARTIFLQATDPAGNAFARREPVTFDFTPPAVPISSNVALTPDAGNALALVDAMRDGVSADMLFFFPEPLEEVLAFTLDCGLTSTSINTATCDVGGALVNCHYELDSQIDTQDSRCRVLLSVRDLALNDAVVDTGAVLVIDRTPPVAADVLDLSYIKHLRAPYGSAQTGLAASSFVVDDALADDDDPRGPSAGLPKELFVTGGDPIAEIRAYAQPVGGPLFALTREASGGRWSPMELPQDLPQVWLVAFDQAGNPSERIRVPRVEWVVTPGQPAFNPHRFVASEDDDIGPLTDQQRDIAGRAAGYPDDNDVVEISPAVSWRWEEDVQSVAPGGSPALATDMLHGRVYAVGPGSHIEMQNHWEKIGSVALNTYGQLAYDPHEDLVSVRASTEMVLKEGAWVERPGIFNLTALYGGAAYAWFPPMAGRISFGGHVDTGMLGGESNNETYFGSGGSWQKMSPGRSPSKRAHATLAYDPNREVLWLFGGDGGALCGPSPTPTADLWTFDGNTWTEELPAGGITPLPRCAAGVAFDPLRDELVVFGGKRPGGSPVSRTEIYDPKSKTWRTAPTRGPEPPQTAFGSLAWHPERRAIMTVAGGDTWLFGPNGWAIEDRALEVATTPHASSQNTRGFCFHAPSENLWWMYELNSNLGVYSHDGSQWLSYSGATGEPDPNGQTTLGCDERRGRPVSFGFSVVQSFTGSQWLEDTTSTTLNGFRMSTVYHPPTQRSLLIGGLGASDMRAWDARWEMGSNAWMVQDIQNTSASPGERVDMGIAYDPNMDRVVLFGGRPDPFDDTSWMNETWLFHVDTGEWTMVPEGLCPSSPPPRYAAGMAFHPELEKVVLFAGFNPNDEALLWAFDGACWDVLDTEDPEGDYDPPDGNASLAWDPSRERMFALARSTLWSLTVPQQDARAAQVFVVGLGDIQDNAPFDIQRVSVVAKAGASVGATNGAELRVFDSGRWVTSDSNAAPVDTPADLSWTSANPNAAADIVHVNHVGVQLRAAVDNGLDGASLAADYVEVRVNYELQ
jgi:hypothetical protein